MAEITAALVKQLRVETGTGMMDCKKALIETDGDMEAAVDWLRTKGLASAAKKAGRVASEGLVGVATGLRGAAVVEINAETDFVARNENFQELVRTVATLAIDHGGSIDDLAATAFPGGAGSVSEKITALISTIGENIQLRRCAALTVNSGIVATYIHGASAPDLGRIAVLVALESSGDEAKLTQLGKQVAMHIAAAQPQALSIEDLDQAVVERERNILIEQARESGKPEEIIEKMIVGRMRKYYEEVVLLEQVFVVDGENKLAKVIENAAGDIGAEVRIAGFVRFALGEGIEKKTSDFAAEVAAQAAG
jgi:elongation factor Ts